MQTEMKLIFVAFFCKRVVTFMPFLQKYYLSCSVDIHLTSLACLFLDVLPMFLVRLLF